MKEYISCKPTFKLRQLIHKKENESDIFPFDQKTFYYFYSARYALSAGINALSIRPDDAVLVPSYNCYTEIDPFIYKKIEPIFYNVKKNLVADFEDLSRKIRNNVKAILVTHFLGFPQPVDEIKRICKERNLFLIEDCAHALLSSNYGKPLGSYGDIAVFSLLKTLPVPNGGILLVNNKNLRYKHKSEKPNKFATYYYAAELLKKVKRGNRRFLTVTGQRMLYGGSCLTMLLARYILAGVKKIINQDGLYLVRPDSYLFVKNVCNWGISDVSKNIMNGQNFEEIKTIRRRNFEYLLNYFLKNLPGILPFKHLPQGVCPLFFPIIVESPAMRDNLYRVLKRQGVTTQPYWNRFHPAVPWHEFPDAVYLKQRILGLPIHQDLTFSHLDRTIDELEKACEKGFTKSYDDFNTN